MFVHLRRRWVRAEREHWQTPLEEIAVYIALLGVDFVVEEPPELAAVIRTLAERLTRAGR